MSIKNRLFIDGIKYSSQRKKSTRSFASSVFSILSALIVALLVAAMLGYNPIEICAQLFTVGFENYKDLINFTGALVLSGLAFTMTAKAGIFNIGISGQMLGAGTVMVFVIKLFNQYGITDDIPNGAGQVIIVAIAMLVGALFALLVGVMEVYLKVNSVVSAILLNWIIYFCSFYLIATFAENRVNPLDPDSELLGSILFPDNFRLIDTQWNTGGLIPIVTIVAVIAISMFVLFKCTVFGHKIVSVGLNKDASQYAGYKVNKIRLSTFALSGCISGLLACVVYTTSIVPAIPLNISSDSIPTEGFEGIAISLIGQNNPIAIIFIGFLFALFKNSMPGIAIPPSYFNVLIGLIMVGATISVLLLKWKPIQLFGRMKYSKQYYKVKHDYDTSLNVLISKYKSIVKWEKQNIYKQNISSAQKSHLWSETKREISADYKTEIKMVKDEFKQSLWKLRIDKDLVHEYAYHNELKESVDSLSLKAMQKITKLKEKNYQYEMNILSLEDGIHKIKLQSKIEQNLIKINLLKQINNIRCEQIDNQLKIKFDNNDNGSLKSKFISDAKATANAAISKAKVDAMYALRTVLFNEAKAIEAFKLSKKKSNVDQAQVEKQQTKDDVEYEAIANKLSSTVKYLNETATIEQTEMDKLASIAHQDDKDDTTYKFDVAVNSANATFKTNVNNADYSKLMASLNYKYDKENENGIGETSQKLINKTSSKEFKWAKNQYKQALMNIKAHKAISKCKLPLDQQNAKVFETKANKLKAKADRISNPVIKQNVMNYLDGLIYSKGAYQQPQVDGAHEGGNE